MRWRARSRHRPQETRARAAGRPPCITVGQEDGVRLCNPISKVDEALQGLYPGCERGQIGCATAAQQKRRRNAFCTLPFANRSAPPNSGQGV
jgi:hypothetical protein